MQRVALEPPGVHVLREEIGRRAAVGGHRAVAVRLHERHDDSRAPAERAAHADAPVRELAPHDRARVVLGLHRNDPGARAERRHPGCNVRGLPARRQRRLGHGVVAGGQASVEPDDHVEEQISEGADEHRTAARRRRPMRSPSRTTPAGLAAFEDAPCYGETLAKEAEAERR